MKTIGEVAAILNEVHLVLHLTEGAASGEEVGIYGRLALPTHPDNLPLSDVIYPKGSVRVLTEQGQGYYLAARYRDEKERKIRKSLGIYSSLLGEQEVVETVYGDWSAALSKEQSLNVALDRSIKVGDLVGR